jgi:hypothetical protein
MSLEPSALSLVEYARAMILRNARPTWRNPLVPKLQLGNAPAPQAPASPRAVDRLKPPSNRRSSPSCTWGRTCPRQLSCRHVECRTDAGIRSVSHRHIPSFPSSSLGMPLPRKLQLPPASPARVEHPLTSSSHPPLSPHSFLFVPFVGKSPLGGAPPASLPFK